MHFTCRVRSSGGCHPLLRVVFVNNGTHNVARCQASCIRSMFQYSIFSGGHRTPPLVLMQTDAGIAVP